MATMSTNDTADRPADRHGLEVLPLSSCLTLLRSRPMGRLAYLDAGGPTVVPVNHLVDGTSVVLRSLGGGKLDAALVGAQVAFQLDDYDPNRRTGWSVLVRGQAEVIDDPAESARFSDGLDSWGVHEPASASWIRIRADEISGRRLRRDPGK